jgi:hypothetical protein
MEKEENNIYVTTFEQADGGTVEAISMQCLYQQLNNMM